MSTMPWFRCDVIIEQRHNWSIVLKNDRYQSNIQFWMELTVSPTWQCLLIFKFVQALEPSRPWTSILHAEDWSAWSNRPDWDPGKCKAMVWCTYAMHDWTWLQTTATSVLELCPHPSRLLRPNSTMTPYFRNAFQPAHRNCRCSSKKFPIYKLFYITKVPSKQLVSTDSVLSPSDFDDQ